jgi:hypothetical protein
LRGAAHRDHLIDETEIVHRKDPEAVADLVVDAAAGDIEFDMPGLLAGARGVQKPAPVQRRFDWEFATTPPCRGTGGR